METGRGGEGGIAKKHEDSFWGNGYVNYLDRGGGLTSVYVSKLIKL